MFEEEAILTEANDSIRSQISSFRCHKMIKEVPLFKDTDENFRLQLASLLHLEVYNIHNIVTFLVWLINFH